MRGIIVGIMLLVIISFAGSIFSSYKKETITVKIEDVIQQQHYKRSENGGSTEYRYLVVTLNETFECQTSFWNMHFNKSDIFYHIKKDSTYTFVVCGFGKSLVTDYRNILEIKK